LSHRPTAAAATGGVDAEVGPAADIDRLLLLLLLRDMRVARKF